MKNYIAMGLFLNLLRNQPTYRIPLRTGRFVEGDQYCSLGVLAYEAKVSPHKVGEIVNQFSPGKKANQYLGFPHRIASTNDQSDKSFEEMADWMEEVVKRDSPEVVI